MASWQPCSERPDPISRDDRRRSRRPRRPYRPPGARRRAVALRRADDGRRRDAGRGLRRAGRRGRRRARSTRPRRRAGAAAGPGQPALAVDRHRRRRGAQPEVADRLRGLDERVEPERLAHVGVRVVAVGEGDVRRRRGGGEHDHRDLAQARVGLDLGEHRAPVHPRQVEVEQHEPGQRALAAQARQGGLAVGDALDLLVDRRLAQRLLDEDRVGLAVLHEQDVAAHAVTSWTAGRRGRVAAGRVKEKPLPPSGPGCPQIRPPWDSTMRLASARPMPVPGYMSAGCSRPNILKITSWSSPTPIPLSRTEILQPPASRAAETWTSGTVSGAVNLIALAIRFCSTWASWPRSPRTVGSGSWLTFAPRSWIAGAIQSVTSASTASRSTSSSRSGERPTRE